MIHYEAFHYSCNYSARLITLHDIFRKETIRIRHSFDYSNEPIISNVCMCIIDYLKTNYNIDIVATAPNNTLLYLQEQPNANPNNIQ